MMSGERLGPWASCFYTKVLVIMSRNRIQTYEMIPITRKNN